MGAQKRSPTIRDSLVTLLILVFGFVPALAEEKRIPLGDTSELTVTGRIELDIVQGERNELVLTAISEPDLEQVQVFENNGQISLRNTGAALKAQISLSDLSLLNVSGGATVSVNNFSLSELEAKVFTDSRIGASGSCTTLTARTNFFDGCDSNEQPVFDASQLVCEKVVFTLRGENCSAAVHATNELIYEFRDDGVIDLFGSPEKVERKGRTELGELNRN